MSCLCRERVFRTGVLVCKGCSEAPRLPAAPPVEQQCQLLAAAPGRPAGVLGQASSLGGHPADGLGTHQWLLPLVISPCLRTKIISPCGQVSPCWLLSLGRFALLLFQHVFWVVLKPFSSNSLCCGQWRGCGRCFVLSGMTFSSVDGSSILPAANLRFSFVLQSLSALERWWLMCFCAGH